jgi:hypothetical protein
VCVCLPIVLFTRVPSRRLPPPASTINSLNLDLAKWINGWMDEYGKDEFSERKGDVFARPVLMKQSAPFAGGTDFGGGRVRVLTSSHTQIIF